MSPEDLRVKATRIAIDAGADPEYAYDAMGELSEQYERELAESYCEEDWTPRTHRIDHDPDDGDVQLSGEWDEC